MKRYKITFAYDGSNFMGYQFQPGLRTVQGEMEEALKIINNNKKTSLNASGRTDALVHAKGQVAHADIDVSITPYKLKRALNTYTSDDIHVISCEEVNDDFHARYNVKSKEYEYIINLGEFNVHERCYVYQACHKLDIEKMKEGLSYLKGKHDFRAFVSENKEKENCVRTITSCKIYQDKVDKDKYHIYFKGTGFLKYQIRNMVGTLIRIGEGKMEPSNIKKILDSKDRGKAGRTAPPEGLYLLKVNY